MVEYEGQQHANEQETKDTRGKKITGDQWQKVSDGRCVFVLATMKNKDAGEIRKQIKEALGG